MSSLYDSINVLQPGDILAPLEKDEELVVWKRVDSYDEEFVCEIPGDSLMILLQVKDLPKEERISERWSKAYYILAPTGASGWVGSGWVKQAL